MIMVVELCILGVFFFTTPISSVMNGLLSLKDSNTDMWNFQEMLRVLDRIMKTSSWVIKAVTFWCSRVKRMDSRHLVWTMWPHQRSWPWWSWVDPGTDLQGSAWQCHPQHTTETLFQWRLCGICSARGLLLGCSLVCFLFFDGCTWSWLIMIEDFGFYRHYMT